MTGPFAEHALELHRRGWHPIPVDPFQLDENGKKKPSIRGVTGKDGIDLTEGDVGRHVQQRGDHQIGLRMDMGMIGIDVDQRDGKTGWDKLLKYQADNGLPDLPPTIYITSKQWPSCILLYRVPPDRDWTYNDSAIGDVDILQRHHRFAMAPGSAHPKTGAVYTATDQATDEQLEVLPYADEIVDLPPEWEAVLRKTDRPAERRDPVEWGNDHRDDNPSESVIQAFQRHWADKKDDGRHPAMCATLTALWRLDQLGEPGTGAAFDRLRREFIQAVTADDSRSPDGAADEFDSASTSARAEVAATASTRVTAAEIDAMFDEWKLPGTGDSGGGDPARFLGRDGLLAENFGRHIVAQGPIRPGLDGRLWAWTDGYWQPTGAEETRRRVRCALGQRFRPAHVNTMTEWLRAEETLDPNQPDFATINCASGLLDWRTGHLRPHTPDHPSTTRLPIRWNPDAECPAIDELVHQILDDDAVPMFYELVGYLCAAGNPLHVAVLLLGSGRNGKGTLLRLIEALLGQANCANVTPHQLADNRFAAAGLYGKLANIAGDLEARLIERTDLFKMATGGDTISAEHKYGAAFTFRCWATFVFSANEAPAVRDHSEGYYARWQVLPFDRVIPEADRLPEHVLAARLHTPAELEGMFARGVEGLRRLMDRGRFAPPASVQAATEKFRTDTDPIAQFLLEELHVDPDGWAPRSTLYAAYREWCQENGRGSVAASKFYTRLPEEADLRTRRGVRGFVGIALGAAPDLGVREGAEGADAPTPSRTYGGKGRGSAPSAPFAPSAPVGLPAWDEAF